MIIMKKIILNIVVLFLILTLNSCFGFYHDDLGKNYAWIEDREIVKITGETYYSLDYNSIVLPQVLNYAYDDKYIIAYQVYDGSEFYYVPREEEIKDSLYALYSKQKELKHCYWIIDKETDQVMGPMRKSEFEKKCTELHVKASMDSSREKTFKEIKDVSLYMPDSCIWEYDMARRDSIKKASESR